jgi:hypothetical protein
LEFSVCAHGTPATNDETPGYALSLRVSLNKNGAQKQQFAPMRTSHKCVQNLRKIIPSKVKNKLNYNKFEKQE